MITAMSAISIVLFVVLSIINGYSYYHNSEESQRILEMLLDNNGSFPVDKGQPMNGKKKPGFGPETPFETRYFTVVIQSDGTVVSTDTSHIMAVDKDQAITYAKSVMNGNSSGLTDIYRYRISTEDDTYTIVFLDDSRNLSSFQSTLKSSILTSVIGLCAVALLLYVFSDRAISPIMKSYERQKRFITDASHELKTPLTVMNADVDLIEMECGESEWIQDLRIQSKTLTDMTNNMIAMARMEEEKPAMTMIDIPLSDIVEECTFSFHTSLQAHHLTLQNNIEPFLTITADDKMIHQLISILMDNAIKYGKEGTVIHVTLHKENRNAVLTVSDTSALLLTENDCRHVFDRFYRSDESRASSIKGSGLGLSLAKHIVELHHGNISADIDTDQLFTIHITLPVQKS